MIRSIGVALASASVCWLVAGTAVAQTIGTTTEARNEVSGQLNTTVRQISSGSGVSSNETVNTGPASAGAFRFVDGSNLSVGERSSVVLDKFVFDPNGPDDVVINVTRGAMRFVSGGIGPRSATVVTPGAILGTRN